MCEQKKIDLFIVDDDAMFASYVLEVAEACGLSAEIIAESSKFQARFEVVHPAIVVLDIAMPGIDGVQLSQWLGRIARSRQFSCRLIIISGYGAERIRICNSVAALAGVDDVQGFSKPIDVDTLEAALLGRKI